MVFGYLSYLLAYKVWVNWSEESSQLFEPAPQTLKENHAYETFLAADNPNLEFPRREDFFVAKERNYDLKAEWMKPSEAEGGYYACGITIKNEGALTFGDDSANNAFKIHYCLDDWGVKYKYSEDLNHGEYGTWGKDYMCPDLSYISAVEVIVEDYRVGMSDWSSINGLYFYCSDLNGQLVKEINAHDGSWGSRRNKVSVPGRFVCGAQVAYDNNKNGKSKDRIGLDGLLLKFCNWNDAGNLSSIIEGSWGVWKDTVIAWRDYLACGFSGAWIKDSDESGFYNLGITYCNIYDWYIQYTVQVIGGLGNSLWSKTKFCKEGQFIDRVMVQNMEPQGPNVDDLAITGLWLGCSLPSDRNQTSDMIYLYDVDQKNVSWGELKAFSPNYLCGVSGRFDYTPLGHDSTALNGLRMKFCEYKQDIKDFITLASSNYGEWQQAHVPSEGKVACGLRIRSIDFYPGYDRLDSMSFVYCSISNWSSQEDKIGQEKRGFDNKFFEYICPKDHFIDWIKIGTFNGDRAYFHIVSIIAIEFNCYGGNGSQKVFKHEFRSWQYRKYWDLFKYDGNFICGEQQLIDPYISRPEVSGLYGLRVKYCPARQDVGKFIDIVVGEWGVWQVAQYAEKDYFTCGVSVQLSEDSRKGEFNTIETDKMGIMGLQLINCHKDDWTNKRSVTKFEIFEYGWYKQTMCPQGSFIIGASAKFQEPQGRFDDLAVSGLKIICSKSKFGGDRTELTVIDSAYGNWLQPVIGQGFVCGAKTRIDTTKQFHWDASGLNSISFNFC